MDLTHVLLCLAVIFVQAEINLDWQLLSVG